MLNPFLVVFYLRAGSYSQSCSSGQVTKHGEVRWCGEREVEVVGDATGRMRRSELRRGTTAFFRRDEGATG